MPDNKIKLDKLVQEIDFIKRLYDIVRIVDPKKKQVLEYEDSELVPVASTCYSFWENDTMCDNCISGKALEQGDTYAKIEYKDDHVYMIMAIPIQLENGYKVVLELLRDITNERILFDLVTHTKKDPYKLLKNRNINIIRDSLTNLYNMRYIHERLPYDILHSHIMDEHLSIIMIDIDDFKGINESHGHNCGNITLMEAAKLIDSRVKPREEWVARYNADTFMVVMRNCTQQRALEWAEDLRKIFQESIFCCEHHCFNVTISTGIFSTYKASIPMEKFIENAKEALGQAKENGKNCVAILERS